ncbi:TPA: hypothetical protein ACXI8I_004732, partial [Serratia marcescens]
YRPKGGAVLSIDASARLPLGLTRILCRHATNYCGETAISRREHEPLSFRLPHTVFTRCLYGTSFYYIRPIADYHHPLTQRVHHLLFPVVMQAS